MAYAVKFERAATKALRPISAPQQRRIVAAIEALVDNPHPAGSTKLTGFKGFYRIRVGDYRVIYTVDSDVLLILVVRIAGRGDIYKHLALVT